ncbi:hypothetical protein K435DRAFT_303015 [Dendrothele bispora CBS 962.96]|uniref:Uncharacterized protein n=1 Tax=Dendrothele bispora (strain CBS 962.96) TaxID=1314807 RepID=A0A4S8LJR1_DENBC|nr:hypothetical protein K435DRAFT_303015 [Dendrothele bispora CBS 962.96]
MDASGYYTAVLYNRALNSLPVVIRRFIRKEDRDRFMALLDRYGWTPLAMKKFWALTINGDPCLVVDSAGNLDLFIHSCCDFYVFKF